MSDKTPKTSRLDELEVIRTVSFLAVVLQHILGAYARRAHVPHWQNLVIGVLFGLCKFAVPAFLFVSGVVLFRRYYGRLKYAEFLKKRLASIVLPYLIWSVLYFIYRWHVDGAMPAKRAFLKSVITGDVSYHTWYVILILQFYVFLPLIFWLFKLIADRVKGKGGAGIAVCLCAAAYCAVLVAAPAVKDVPVLGDIFYRYQARNFIFYLIYFLLGGVCGLYLDRFRELVRRSWWIFAAAAAVMYALVETRMFRDNYSGYVLNVNAVSSMNILMFLFTAVCIILLYALAVRLKECRMIRRVCTWVGKHSYTAYLAHAMVIGKTSLELLEHFPGLSYPVFYAVLTVGSVGGSLFLAWLFDAVYGGVRRMIQKGVIG